MTAAGGPEVLEYVELEHPQPGPDDVIVELAAAGLNYIDTYQRSGLYPVPLPYSQLGSLFLTRPTSADYTATRAELERRSGELFGWRAAGQLDVEVGLRLPLSEAAGAHRRLQSRATSGKVLLIP